MTFTTPAVCAGVVAVIEVGPLTITLVARFPPMLTVAPVLKFEPVIETPLPPIVVPEAGLMPDTVGPVKT